MIFSKDSSSDIIIKPKDFLLAKTQEKITLSPKIACMIFTISQMTLEIFNHSNQTVTLKFGQTVIKAVFIEVK